MRPDLMTVTPAVADPGQHVELTFPLETGRGVAYVLELAVGDTWTTTHYLTSSSEGYDATPSAVSVDSVDDYFGWEDIGIGGPGPDRILIPDDALTGPYRLCTANALENFCAEINLGGDEGRVPTPTTTASPETTTVPGSTASPGATGVPTTTAAEARIPIVSVHEDVEYYIACADVPVTLDGIRWYPVADWGNEQTAEVLERIMGVDRERPAGPVGFAPRVSPPGPGDDIGTVYVYADGFAWFESDSGQTIWLTQEEIVYTWVC